MSEKKYGMAIDQERCIGCETCVVACNIENNSFKPWINVSSKTEGKSPGPMTMEFMPLTCHHCSDPPCVAVCPREALVKRPDGIVVVGNEEECDACRMCTDVCPYDVIVFNRNKGKVEKCNFCVHRVDEGLLPFCVVCCEGKAIHFGDLNDPESDVSKFIAKYETFRLKIEAGWEPNTYYRPPMPKRKL